MPKTKLTNIKDRLAGRLTREDVVEIRGIVRDSLGEEALQYFCHFEDDRIVVPDNRVRQIRTAYEPAIGVGMTHWITRAARYLRTRIFARNKASLCKPYHQAIIRGLRNAMIDLTPQWWEMVKTGQLVVSEEAVFNPRAEVRNLLTHPNHALRAFLEKLNEDKSRKGEKIEIITNLKEFFKKVVIPTFQKKKQKMSLGERVDVIKNQLEFLKTDLLRLMTFLNDEQVAQNDTDVFLIDPRLLAKGIVHSPSGESAWLGYGKRMVGGVKLGGSLGQGIQAVANDQVVSARDIVSYDISGQAFYETCHPLLKREFRSCNDWDIREDTIVPVDLSDTNAVAYLNHRADEFISLLPIIQPYSAIT